MFSGPRQRIGERVVAQFDAVPGNECALQTRRDRNDKIFKLRSDVLWRIVHRPHVVREPSPADLFHPMLSSPAAALGATTAVRCRNDACYFAVWSDRTSQ